jgi:5-methylcytosine-specific restriction endonuclease McrA
MHEAACGDGAAIAAPRGAAGRRRPLTTPMGRNPPDTARLDRVVAQARRDREARESTYRERALKLFPWICGRCAREFDRTNLQQLTVHHKDHNHDNNPADGSNWELLCVYCHDNEHSRELEAAAQRGGAAGDTTATATHRPFAALAGLLKGRSDDT